MHDHRPYGATESRRKGVHVPIETLSNIDPALRRAWHPVAYSHEVNDRPVQVRLLGETWALARLPDGDGGTTLAAFRDRCPHRFAPLSAGSIVDGGLRCGYHGWCFAADGTCTDIPALTGTDRRPGRADVVVPVGVTEHLGLVFVAIETPVAALLDVAPEHDATFLRGDLPAIRTRACAGLLLDNFLDMAHFPFVHAATIGLEDAVDVPVPTVDRTPGGLRSVTTHPFPNREDPGVATGERPLVQHRRLTYEVALGFSAVLSIDYVEAGGTNVVGFFVQPEDAEHCRIYTMLWRNDLEGDADRMAHCVAFERRILEEDLGIQSRYETLTLPLDPTVEVHTKADRLTLELRRLLREFVDQAG
jgi:phenylpropionate dioxygenase-like ring-hydroxylating dioxygenase large terminal subunit